MSGKTFNIDNYRVIGRLFRENFRRHAVGYGVAIGAMLVVAATTALSAYIMKDVTNEFFLSRDVNRIYSIALFVAGIFFLKGIAIFVQTYALSRVGNGIVADQQRRIYDRILRHGLEFFQSYSSGDLITRVTHNAQAVRAVLDTVIVSFARDLFTLIGLVAVMVYQQPTLSAIAFVTAPIAILGVTQLVKRVRKLVEKEFLSLAEMVQTMQETIIGARIVKSFNLENRLRDRMYLAISNVEERANGIAYLGAFSSPVMETLGGLAIALVIAIGGTLIIEQGQTPGELMSFITALLLAYEPAKRLARVRISLETGIVGAKMMFSLLDRPFSIEEAPEAKTLVARDGRIEFDGVGFGYRDDQNVLKNLTLTIPAGKVTALVGPSGGGKSTVMNLILRLYDPDQGEIRIDGQPIRDVTFHSLREHVAYVSQDTFLFAGTVRDNIAMGREGATSAEIEAAATAAFAHEFIITMPQGYDTQVGENGAQLSGGQKQRIAIARALLKNAPIVLLDEATSALDSESESKVKQAFDVLLEGRTALVIAHRLSTVRSAHQICVMKDGELVEQGTHAELVRKGGLYSSLSRLQFEEAA